MSSVRSTLVVSGVLVAAAGLAAQDRPRFQSSVDVVTVTATVTDKDGRFVAGLGKDDFTIFEDGQPRDVSYCGEESSPVSLAILLDASGSMTRGKLDLGRALISR